MQKLMEVNKKIENAVVGTYRKIENGVTNGYKKMENEIVSGYKKVENYFVDTFFCEVGETTEHARERLRNNQKDK